MRDAGLYRAIDAAGGVAQLARKIHISQPSISNWSKIPAQRVIAVEAATGVPRAELRPDLYPDHHHEHTASQDSIDPIDVARAQEYVLLAALLAAAPSKRLLDRLTGLSGDGTPLGQAHAGLAEAASHTTAAQVEREYFDLFVGLGRGELLPYASYYLTGFLNERPLSRLRTDLAELGIARAEGNSEPEDHAAILCAIMAGMADGRWEAPFVAQRALFEKHVSSWMGRLFGDMEQAASARFYRTVGTFGRLFIEIERQGFSFAKWPCEAGPGEVR
ncbi:molecular chaperone [Bradyrhizobium canariense]|uniref:molecular chaperone TorD family protein n=1 Tax=Bradyrhizobium canariense TaxID=255045 RepID=UPI001CA537FC|nr:molecular chaperone TorD family protein [Bradyrhizobium canariense]MBW5434088.1 molecular chaperone [Bradyrhizobium canariense]